MSQPNLNCEVVNRESSGLEQLRGSQQSGGDRNGARSHPHPPPRGREHHRVGCGPRKCLPSDSPTWRSWFYKGSWPMPSKQFSPKSISQVVTWFYFKRRLCLKHNKTRAWLIVFCRTFSEPRTGSILWKDVMYKVSLFFILFMYLFLVTLGLYCCAWAFSSCGERGLLSSCSTCISYCSGFSYCGAWALGTQALAVVALRL